MDIAKYTVSLGLSPHKDFMRDVDKTLKLLEKKLKKINFGNSFFKIDQKKLQMSMGKALDAASKKVVFEIANFKVNKAGLQKALNKAQRAGTANISLADDRVAMLRHLKGLSRTGATASGDRGTYVNTRSLSPQEWDRREAVKRKDWLDRRQMLREDQAARLAARAERVARSGGVSGRTAVGAGIAGGLSARMYGPAIAIGMGGYGMASLNRRNQETISAQLTTQAVTEAAGLQGQGPEAFEWLRNQGNRIGFNYLDQAQDYNNYLSNALGAGMELGDSQETYLGFAEYSRAMGISPHRNKLVMNALSQMMGKGTVQMEELKRQMAESMPGTMAVFAESYQNMLQAKGEGGGKTGNEALAQLYEDVPKGKLVTSELAPYLTEVLRRKAAPKLDIAMNTSQAWQQRFQNVVSDMSILAGKNGVEEGFKNIFRSLTQGLQESGGLVKSLASSFESATVQASKLLLWPQSFVRALEGRDSLVAEWLGLDATVQLRDDWTEIRNLFQDITGMESPSFMPTLEATTREIAGMLKAIGAFTSHYAETKVSTQQVMEDVYYGSDTSTPTARTIANIKSTLAGNVHSMSTLFGGEDSVANYWMNREAADGFNTRGMYNNEPEAWRSHQKDLRKAAAYDVFGQGGAGISPTTAGSYIAEQNNKFEIVIPEAVRDVEGIDDWFRNSFGTVVTQTLTSFANRETN